LRPSWKQAVLQVAQDPKVLFDDIKIKTL